MGSDVIPSDFRETNEAQQRGSQYTADLVLSTILKLVASARYMLLYLRLSDWSLAEGLVSGSTAAAVVIGQRGCSARKALRSPGARGIAPPLARAALLAGQRRRPIQDVKGSGHCTRSRRFKFGVLQVPNRQECRRELDRSPSIGSGWIR